DLFSRNCGYCCAVNKGCRSISPEKPERSSRGCSTPCGPRPESCTRLLSPVCTGSIFQLSDSQLRAVWLRGASMEPLRAERLKLAVILMTAVALSPHTSCTEEGSPLRQKKM